ncbi:MAG: endonuclease/exonuclease/phosphatase family protein [Desertimonas sp.]
MAPGRLRIVQLNAASLIEPDWEHRRGEVAAWIDHLDPDVVCLQEIWEDASHPCSAGEVVERLDGGSWHWVFGGGPFEGMFGADGSLRFGSAVLSRWPIDDHTYHRLPVGPGASGFLAAVPWELLHVRTAGLDVCSTHLAAAPTDGVHRCLQVAAIDEIIGVARGDADAVTFGRPRAGMPAILCGDFNAEPDSDEIRFLCGLTDLDGRTTYYQDAWRQAGEGVGFTQDWTSHPIAGSMNVARKRIDYVFVGDAFQRAEGAGRVLRAERAFDRPMTGVQASDHVGLVVDLAWPGGPTRP